MVPSPQVTGNLSIWNMVDLHYIIAEILNSSLGVVEGFAYSTYEDDVA